MTAPNGKVCDNASVGVLITDDAGRYLMFDRATPPPGCAPPAGHVWDDHRSYDDAARAEVSEEVGLTVETLERLPIGGWRHNRCRRTPGSRGLGHEWQVFRATVTGTLVPSVRETRNVRWLTVGEMQALAERTVSYAYAEMSDAEFARAPGIEPVWVGCLADLDLVSVSDADRLAVEFVARGGA
jgi:ADP-ribose pyrophosphatase YjhB (NUDIX family)